MVHVNYQRRILDELKALNTKNIDPSIADFEQNLEIVLDRDLAYQKFLTDLQNYREEAMKNCSNFVCFKDLKTLMKLF